MPPPCNSHDLILDLPAIWKPHSNPDSKRPMTWEPSCATTHSMQLAAPIYLPQAPFPPLHSTAAGLDGLTHVQPQARAWHVVLLILCWYYCYYKVRGVCTLQNNYNGIFYMYFITIFCYKDTMM